MDILQRYYNGFDDTKLTTEEVAIVDDMVSEIEQLRKEKEWLIEKLVSPIRYARKDRIIYEMQQALKEG